MKRWNVTPTGMDLSDDGRWCEWSEVNPIIQSLMEALETKAPDLELKSEMVRRGQEIEALKLERDATRKIYDELIKVYFQAEIEGQKLYAEVSRLSEALDLANRRLGELAHSREVKA